MSLQVGDAAPDFILPNQDGTSISLSALRGQRVVIYFYPKASTPGCTVQACGIRDSAAAFKKLNTVVVGISPDPIKRLQNFIDKQGLNFDLLSDEDHSIADKYGAWGPKKFMGKEYDGILRSTFIVGKDGKLKAIMDKVKTKSHHDDVIDWIKANL